MPLSPELSAVTAATKGFLPADEGEALLAAALQAPPGLWLEVGTYCGKSTVHLGSAARTTADASPARQARAASSAVRASSSVSTQVSTSVRAPRCVRMQ